MAGGPGEYEVETIVRAKVAKKRARKVWLYCVKWKGYGTEDNTWEPVDSFIGGSEHFIEFFWDRVNTDGRDYHNIREFAVEEEFFPSGPPRRKKAKKTEEPEEVIEIPSSPSAAANVDSENEVCSIIDDDEQVVTATRNKRRRSSAAADAEPSPSKRAKRGRPPGKRATGLEAEQGAAKTLSRKRSVPEIPRTTRGHMPVAEASGSSARKPSIPRTRRRASQTAPRASSSSPDELLLHPETNGKSRSSPTKRKNAGSRVEAAIDVDDLREGSASGDAAKASAMIVDDFEDEPATFGTPSLLAPGIMSESVSEPGPSTSLPAHRMRAANPRVKVLDDHNLTGASGALSVKAKFMKHTAGASASESTAGSPARSGRISKGKAGPGRSSSGLVGGGSRLVAQKGKLTTVKSTSGARSNASQGISSIEQNGDDGLLLNWTDVDDVPGLGALDDAPKPPPSGQELLKQAGLDAATANDLPDFEEDAEDAEGEDDVEFVENPSQPQGALLPNGQAIKANEGTSEIAAPEEAQKLPEKAPVVLEARPLTFASRVTSIWSQSTIFGPLALGLSPTRLLAQEESGGSSFAPKRYTLNLNLDSAVSLPITLKDTEAPMAFLEKIDINARNPTGKFYKDENAIALVNTLSPQGSYARISLSEGASDEQKQHFERFVSRMLAGELFIQMNRFEPLVMCASENSVLGQKLGVPAPLLGLAETVVVVHVSIDDHCAYADAADRADGARW